MNIKSITSWHVTEKDSVMESEEHLSLDVLSCEGLWHLNGL